MFYRYLIFFLLLSQPTNLSAQKLITGPIDAELIRVIDGEHIEVLAQWPDQKMSKKVIKLMSIDAPELDGDCPQERELARQAINRLATLLSKKITLHNIMSSDIDEPVLAQVSNENGLDPVPVLTRENLARPYWGGHAFGWCADQKTCLVANCD